MKFCLFLLVDQHYSYCERREHKWFSTLQWCSSASDLIQSASYDDFLTIITDRFWTWTRWWSSADSPALRSPACKGSAGTCGVSSCRCRAPRSWGSPEHRWNWSPTRTLCDWAFCADPHTGTLDRCCSSPQVWMVYWLWHNRTPEGLQSGVESSDAHMEETSCWETSVMNSWFVMFFIIYCCSWSSLDKRSSSHTVESWSSSVSLTRFAPFINYLLFYSSWIFSLNSLQVMRPSDFRTKTIWG